MAQKRKIELRVAQPHHQAVIKKPIVKRVEIVVVWETPIVNLKLVLIKRLMSLE